MNATRQFPHTAMLIVCGFLLPLIAACAGQANFAQVIPTDRPTVTATLTETPTRTPGVNATPTQRPTGDPALATLGPTPTSIFGATATPNSLAANATDTRVPNPNAPRIEFFTANPQVVAPGEPVTLFWSARNIDNAIIYRMEPDGTRSELYNVAPDGSLQINTRSSERGQLRFVLSVGEGALRVEQTINIPLACPVQWFFQPAPNDCADEEPQADALIQQPFERGRMVYVTSRDIVYALFNDGEQPAWVAFSNQYDPAIHPESVDNFPGAFQPIAMLGFVWRGNDTVRNRLGLPTEPQTAYDGFLQTATVGGDEVLYISSPDGSVLQLLPDREVWQIISVTP